MAADCPECQLAAAAMRKVADNLARGAGAEIGMMLAGPRGALVGGQLGPELIERGALAVARKVKGKRSSKQRARSRLQKKAMGTAQKRARKANGGFKKGWNQSRLMRTMHAECKKLEKRRR